MGFQLALKEDSRLVLKQAICIYESAAGEAFATWHGVDRTAKAPALGAGRPLTRKALGNVISMLGKGANNGAFLPPEVLSIGFDYMIWHVPPGEQTTFFKDRPNAEGKVAIGTRGGRTPQPGLIFAVSSGSWRVFAVKGATRPVPTSELYHSPYWNVNPAGAICTGNIRTPSTTDPDTIPEWTKLFFSSNFTHTNFHGGQKQVEGEGGVAALWTELLDGKHKEFPEDRLIKTGSTLGDLIKNTNKGGR